MLIIEVSNSAFLMFTYWSNFMEVQTLTVQDLRSFFSVISGLDESIKDVKNLSDIIDIIEKLGAEYENDFFALAQSDAGDFYYIFNHYIAYSKLPDAEYPDTWNLSALLEKWYVYNLDLMQSKIYHVV
jgi:hypothetical protein